jgi:hypothetical protein
MTIAGKWQKWIASTTKTPMAKRGCGKFAIVLSLKSLSTGTLLVANWCTLLVANWFFACQRYRTTMHKFLVGARLRAGDADATDVPPLTEADVPPLTEAELEAATRYSSDMHSEDTDGTSPTLPYPPSFIRVRNTPVGLSALFNRVSFACIQHALNPPGVLRRRQSGSTWVRRWVIVVEGELVPSKQFIS